ncbi:pre-mRNA-processing factor 17 [Octopus vulgaris]|uniref:Pre-mRNA-processing factor 17 n=2 Tax=Octopus TaxID=6643 RepID=A0AA36FFR4_OCTVU|nr:pre-mRNA-processing factor 17 [Octopus sinensis]CAI9735967.1 pre-mRNA-processing factor 17 [Octopus vulgaris]
MSSMLSLQQYASSSEESNISGSEDNGDETRIHLKTVDQTTSLSSKISIVAAPDVVSKHDVNSLQPVDPTEKELKHNPKYDELFTPTVGPKNPFLTQQFSADRNMLSGFVEAAHVNDFQFETQRRTFASYGYATDPSTEIESQAPVIGDVAKAEANKHLTVFEKTKCRPGDKRKRLRNDNAADVDGYLGPWGKFVDEQTVMKPNEEEMKELDEILMKRNKIKRPPEEKVGDEKTTLHIKDATDYQGRSFLHPPHDVGVNLKSDDPPEKCFIPKKLIHTWTGHNKGISAIRWFPRYAHLMLSCSMDSKIKIWEVYNQRRCVRTYLGHKQAVRDICFNNDGTSFLSCAYDRYCKLWDTETGQCISPFSSRKVPYCVKFNPDEDKQNLFVAGTSDKKIVCWDIRSGDIMQEYDRHLGAVNTITFVDQNRRFVTTSDDKSLRVWEWDVPVDFKYIADPSMHSMPAVTLSPNGKWLACQSMDNKICIFNVLNRFKFMKKKMFTGHMVSGYACTTDFSPDMSYIICGDADGKLYIWDWKTTKLYCQFKAHDDVCVATLWHPHETSKVATAGWDGIIKFWD